jgi:hypothetical protein
VQVLRKIVFVLASVTFGVLLASGVALAALPSETPDHTAMVDGPVRTFARVGDNLWLGGNFNQVKNANGQVIDEVSNVAVFDVETGTYKPGIAPSLGAGASGSKVTEIKVYGDNVVIGGNFAGPANKRNLVVADGASGEDLRWFNAQVLEAVLAAPDLDRVYAGGTSLSAFDFSTGEKLWTRAQTTVDQSLYTHELSPGYRDLERDGSTIWGACGCDAVDGKQAKALVKLSTEGVHDASWVGQAGIQGFGISLVEAGDTLYLAAGGNDFLAAYDKAAGGAREWVRDLSGSGQVVEFVDGRLVVGGHFWEVGDQQSDQCGSRSSNNAQTLDPSPGGECETRHGLAAYSFGGVLDGGGTPDNVEDGWNPTLAGQYNLAWALHAEATQGTRLHVGGEFTTVNGIRQTYYARLPDPTYVPPPPPDTVEPNGSVTINDGRRSTSSRSVTLTLAATDPAPGSGVASMRFKNAGTPAWSDWRPYETEAAWRLSSGTGKKKVYVQFKDRASNVSALASDSINYRR